MHFKITHIYKLLAVIVLTAIFGIDCMAAPNDKFTVVIDPGHGGKDVGARDNGVNEKDINLAIAKKVEEYLKKKKDYRVILTRSDDTFLGLKERADKANKAKADLFVSIHTNSVDEKNPQRAAVQGASVYVLGLHRDEDNLAVSRRENSVISIEPDAGEKYENFDPNRDESYIIFEMTQKKNLSKSIGLAKSIQEQIVKQADRKDRGVHQAGFLVLRETAMPAVLVEVDFICNPEAAKFISSSAGQTKLARAIATAISDYRSNLRKNGDKAYAKESFDDEEEVNNNGETYVLEAQNVTQRETKPQKQNNNVASTRQRRTPAAKKTSSARNLQTDSIKVNSQKQATPKTNKKPAKEEPAQKTDTKKEKSKTSRKSVKKK